MDDLVDLVNYVNPQRLKRLSFFYRGKRGRTNTHGGKLYQALIDGKEWDDQIASKELFGEVKSSHYYKVKHDLRQELLNSVLLIDNGQKKRGDYYAGFLRCRKELYAADVLWVEGHYMASMSILKKLLPIAKNLELPEIVIPILHHMRNYVMNYEPDKKEFESLQEQELYWIEKRNIAEKVNRVFEQVYFAFSLSTAPPSEQFKKYEQALDEVLTQPLSSYSAEVICQVCIIRFAAADSVGNYNEAIRICWDSLDELDGKEFLPRGFVRAIYSQIIGVSIKTRSMFHGKRAVIQALKLVDEGDPPWFTINQLYFYLCIRSEEFERAIELCNRIFDHPRFNKQPQVTKERWRLMRAHLSWLLTVDPEKGNGSKLQAFRLGRFLNSVPEFTKDKMGFNVAILSIQILWLVQKRRFGDARLRLESLKRYASKYLAKTAGIIRTYYFIRLLAQLDNADFRKSVFETKAKPFLRTLARLTAEQDLQSVEVEIVPYEMLYQELLKILDDSIH